MQQFQNVQEHWCLYDTVLAYVAPGSSGVSLASGWFNGLGPMGQANDLPFFNIRNRNIGLAYNNQDARDQFPYAMRLFSIGVGFWRTHLSTDINYEPGSPYEEAVGHIFNVDLPRHCSLVLKIQQDERLKTIVPFASPGYGPHGGGYGRGQPSSFANSAMINTVMGTETQGVPDLKRRWIFPDNIEIPRRASVSVTLRFSEYARNLLQAMGEVADVNWPIQHGTLTAATAGVQVSLIGERLVQQRGQYHA